MFSAGLYLRPWKERFNPDTEDMKVAPVWIRMFSLPSEFWDLETLQDIGNSLGEFVKVSEQTKLQRYISYARICVYMDLSKELPEAIRLNWEDEEWIQPLDYEQLPFRCRLCHDYGHLGRNCPKNPLRNPGPQAREKETDEEGFTQVRNKRKSKGSDQQKKGKEKGKNVVVSKNPFQPLVKEKGPVIEGAVEGKNDSTAGKGKELVIPIVTPMEEPESSMAVDGDEEMDLGELDLDELEKECEKKGKGYVSRRQLELLQEAIVRSKVPH